MAYIDTTYIAAHLTETVRAALFVDDPTAQAVLIAESDAAVDGALSQAGYSTGLVAPIPELVKSASLEVFVRKAYGRNGLEPPAGLIEAIIVTGTGNTAAPQGGTLVAAIASGAMPIPGLSVSEADAVGGVLASETSSTVASSRPQIWSSFAIRNLRSGW